MEVVGAGKAKQHVEKAMAYAEQEIRMDLDNYSRVWIEEEVKKRLQ